MPTVTLTHQGRKISAEKSGRGPVVMLIPPGASSGSAWRKVTEDLKSDYTCIAVHPSGYAETEPFHADRAMTLEDEAGAALALLGGEGQPVHLVGHSYGGAVALVMALAHPALFASLTLIEPAVYPMLAEGGETVLDEEVRVENTRFITRARAGEPEAAFEGYFDYYNGERGFWSRMPEVAKQKILLLAPVVTAALTAADASSIGLNDLRRLKVPALVVKGANTDPVHARLSEIVAAGMPQAQLISINGAGHMLSLTHPHEMAVLIARNIASTLGEEKPGANDGHMN